VSGWHPSLVLFAAAGGAALTRGRLRQAVVLAGPLVCLGLVLGLAPGTRRSIPLLGFELEILRVDALGSLFALVLGTITVIGAIYALHRARGGEHAAALVYAGSSLGVVLAGDWLTLFLFWEAMAFSSAFLIWYGGDGARGAGFRYILVHVFGGSLFFAGIVLHLAASGDPSVGPPARGAAFWLILAGVALNAAVPPLHAWLTDAYPEASVSGSVFLSALTTKTAVYVLIRAFAGVELLAWAGVVMALYGVVFAVLENDIRRLLAYHIVSQVGYMVAGVGMGTALALDGAAAHAFCHILYKGLLFMGAGAVIEATGRRKLTELGGIGRRMPAVVALYMIGAFSISGVPLFNGFVSKSMIISAAADGGRPAFELLLLLASVGTFLHTGLKLPWFTFAGPDRGLRPRPVPRNMIVAMTLAAALCIGIGVWPDWLYARLPFASAYHPYTVDHVVASLQLLFGTGVAFRFYLRRLGGEPTVTLDTDWLYRRPLAEGFRRLVEAVRGLGRAEERSTSRLLAAAAPYFRNPFLAMGRARLAVIGDAEPVPEPDSDYDDNRYRLPIGVTVFWVVVYAALLALFLT
jgi:multicomponent Na+:H+ antiporter subunit D